MEDATKIKYELKKTLAHLRGMHGSGTELISVYIPAKGAIHEMSGKLNEEAGQATNIKSKSTRTNVGMALAKIIHHLKTYGHQAPVSGVAIFCGNVSDNQSKSDIQLFTVYPSEPLAVQIYRCDSRFFLEPLERMVDVKDSYGLVVLDGRECTLATLRGTNITVLHRLNSTAHAKIRKGGQCLAPDTMVFASDGNLMRVADVEAGTQIKGADLATLTIGNWICSDKFVTKAKHAFKISTIKPRLEIVATAWHRFFIKTTNGVEEIFAKDLKIGDAVLVAKKIGGRHGKGRKRGILRGSLSEDVGVARVAELVPVDGEHEYVDLTVPNAFNFVANGFIVHNSARRYERLIEESIELYYKRVGEYMDRYYVNSVKGVIIGGPGPTKENFVKMSPFNYQIKVLGVVDTGYTEETGLRELMGKSGDIIGEQEAVKERQIIERFMHEVVSGTMAIYGEGPVREALAINKAKELLISEGLKWKRYGAVCNSCKEEKQINVKEGGEKPSACAKCGGQLSIVSAVDLIDDLIALAEKGSIKVEIISNDTSEGAQFLQSFYGIGAFVRYR